MGETIVSESTRTRAAVVGTVGGAALGLGAYLAGGLGPSREFAVMGAGGYVAVGVALVAAIAHVLGTRTSHENPFRSALALSFAAAPLLCSVGWAALSIERVRAAMLGANTMRDVLLARGMSEAFIVVALGGYLTAGLALGIAFTFDGPFDRGRQGARTTSWFLYLFFVSGALAYVFGEYCDRISRAGEMDAPAFANSALVAVSDARWNSLVAIGIATLLAVRAAVATMRVPARFQGDWVFPVALTGAVALGVSGLVVGAFARADKVCRGIRPEGFAKHLDAFSPLHTTEGGDGDSGAVVVVPGMVVGSTRRGPPTPELFRSLSEEGVQTFAIDSRVDHDTFEGIVRAYASTPSRVFGILGVADDVGWFEVSKRRSTVPLFGAILPVVADQRIDVGLPAEDSRGRSLRVVLRHGGHAYAPVDSRGNQVPPETGEVLVLVLGPDATAEDVLLATAQFEPEVSTRLVTSDTVLPESTALAASETVPPTELAAPPPSTLEATHTEIHGVATDPGILRDLLGTAPPPGAAPTSGSLDRNSIVTTMRRLAPQVSRCYERELERHPDLQGRATVTLAIGPGGHVTSAEVESDDLPESVQTCMARVVRGATFPDPGEGTVNIRYPFVFRAN